MGEKLSEETTESKKFFFSPLCPPWPARGAPGPVGAPELGLQPPQQPCGRLLLTHHLQPLPGVRLEEGPGPVLALEAQALQGGRGHLGLSALHREEELPASLHPGTQLQELCVEQTLSTTIFLRIASSSSQGSSCCPPPPLRLVAGRLVFFFKVFSDSLPLQSREEPVRSQLSSLSSESLLLDSVFFRAEKNRVQE